MYTKFKKLKVKTNVGKWSRNDLWTISNLKTKCYSINEELDLNSKLNIYNQSIGRSASTMGVYAADSVMRGERSDGVMNNPKTNAALGRDMSVEQTVYSDSLTDFLRRVIGNDGIKLLSIMTDKIGVVDLDQLFLVLTFDFSHKINLITLKAKNLSDPFFDLDEILERIEENFYIPLAKEYRLVPSNVKTQSTSDYTITSVDYNQPQKSPDAFRCMVPRKEVSPPNLYLSPTVSSEAARNFSNNRYSVVFPLVLTKLIVIAKSIYDQCTNVRVSVDQSAYKTITTNVFDADDKDTTSLFKNGSKDVTKTALIYVPKGEESVVIDFMYLLKLIKFPFFITDSSNTYKLPLSWGNFTQINKLETINLICEDYLSMATLLRQTYSPLDLLFNNNRLSNLIDYMKSVFSLKNDAYLADQWVHQIHSMSSNKYSNKKTYEFPVLTLPSIIGFYKVIEPQKFGVINVGYLFKDYICISVILRWYLNNVAMNIINTVFYFTPWDKIKNSQATGYMNQKLKTIADPYFKGRLAADREWANHTGADYFYFFNIFWVSGVQSLVKGILNDNYDLWFDKTKNQITVNCNYYLIALHFMVSRDHLPYSSLKKGGVTIETTNLNDYDVAIFRNSLQFIYNFIDLIPTNGQAFWPSQWKLKYPVSDGTYFKWERQYAVIKDFIRGTKMAVSMLMFLPSFSLDSSTFIDNLQGVVQSNVPSLIYNLTVNTFSGFMRWNSKQFTNVSRLVSGENFSQDTTIIVLQRILEMVEICNKNSSYLSLFYTSKTLGRRKLSVYTTYSENEFVKETESIFTALKDAGIILEYYFVSESFILGGDSESYNSSSNPKNVSSNAIGQLGEEWDAFGGESAGDFKEFEKVYSKDIIEIDGEIKQNNNTEIESKNLNIKQKQIKNINPIHITLNTAIALAIYQMCIDRVIVEATIKTSPNNCYKETMNNISDIITDKTKKIEFINECNNTKGTLNNVKNILTKYDLNLLFIEWEKESNKNINNCKHYSEITQYGDSSPNKIIIFFKDIPHITVLNNDYISEYLSYMLEDFDSYYEYKKIEEKLNVKMLDWWKTKYNDYN